MRDVLCIKYHLGLSLALLLTLPLNVLAEEAPPPNGIDLTHKAISDTLLYLPNAIDNFFADERIYEESAQSRFRLNMNTRFKEGGKITYETLLRAKIVLPNTEKKLRLSFESVPNIGSPDVNDVDGEETPQQAFSNAEQAAVLQGIINESRFWQFKADLGMKLHTPVDPFARLRGRRIVQFDNWQLRATQTFFIFKSDGFGETTRIDLERPLSPGYFARATTAGTWWKELEDYLMSQDITLFIQIDDDRALAYRAGIRGSSEPNFHTTSYIVDTKYRERFYKQWMFYEIVTELLYPEEEQFHLTPSIIFKLEVVFGKFRDD